GGTGKTEFEFLTGTSMRMFNSTPYVVLGKKLDASMVEPLESQGYKTAAIHPFIPTNYNREVAYEAMGFDRFLSFDDFQGERMVRDFISDEACFDGAAEMGKDEDDPVFACCAAVEKQSPEAT